MVDEEFVSIMGGVGDDPRVFSLLRTEGLGETLDSILDQLERCQKALAEFLEQKRQAFLASTLSATVCPPSFSSSAPFPSPPPLTSPALAAPCLYTCR